MQAKAHGGPSSPVFLGEILMQKILNGLKARLICLFYKVNHSFFKRLPTLHIHIAGYKPFKVKQGATTIAQAITPNALAEKKLAQKAPPFKLYVTEEKRCFLFSDTGTDLCLEKHFVVAVTGPVVENKFCNVAKTNSKTAIFRVVMPKADANGNALQAALKKKNACSYKHTLALPKGCLLTHIKLFSEQFKYGDEEQDDVITSFGKMFLSFSGFLKNGQHFCIEYGRDEASRLYEELSVEEKSLVKHLKKTTSTMQKKHIRLSKVLHDPALKEEAEKALKKAEAAQKEALQNVPVFNNCVLLNIYTPRFCQTDSQKTLAQKAKRAEQKAAREAKKAREEQKAIEKLQEENTIEAILNISYAVEDPPYQNCKYLLVISGFLTTNDLIEQGILQYPPRFYKYEHCDYTHAFIFEREEDWQALLHKASQLNYKKIVALPLDEALKQYS